MNSVENYAIRYLEPKDVKDLDQYNALLRYTFQVTEDELTATGWKDEEIKQSKFPVLERADVLGCFDGDTLISQFAVYPLKMNIYGEVFPVGFVTSVCTYPEYTGQGIMKKLMYQSLEHMKQQGRPFALLYPYSIPLYHHLGWEIISNKISFNIKDRQIPTKVKAPGVWTGTIPIFMSCIRILHQSHTAACSGMHWRGRNTGAGMRTIRTWQFTITPRTSHADLWSI